MIDPRDVAKKGRDIKQAWQTIEPLMEDIQQSIKDAWADEIDPLTRDLMYHRIKAIKELQGLVNKIIHRGAFADMQIMEAVQEMNQQQGLN